MNKLIKFFRKERLINLAMNFKNILIIVCIFSKLKLWCKPIRVFIAVGTEMDVVIWLYYPNIWQIMVADLEFPKTKIAEISISNLSNFKV